MLSRFTVLLFVLPASLVMVGGEVLSQSTAAKKTAYTDLLRSSKMKPIDPAIVENDPAAKAADAQRARERSKAFNNARKVLSGQLPFDEPGKANLDTWYKGYFLRSFTSPATRGKLPELRQTMLKDLRSARSTAAIVYVRTQVLTYMKAYAQNAQKYNFHPAVRYNAMLLIGELNAVELNARYPDGSKAKVPEPLSAALDTLISEYNSPTQIDAVRIAALVGMDRHAKLDLGRPAENRMPGTKKKAIVDAMITLLNAEPPAGRSAAGHTWMQRRGIDILSALGMVGAYAQANSALEKIVADKDAPMSLRCTAAEALAHWAPNTKEKINAGKVSENLGLIAVKACKDELDRIAALVAQEEEMAKLRELIKKPNPAAEGQIGPGAGSGYEGSGAEEMYGGAGEETMMDGSGDEEMYGGDEAMMMEGMSDMMYGGAGGILEAETPTDPRIIWSQRRLKYQLTCVKRGLEGMAIAGAASQQEDAVTEVATAVETALSFTDPPEEKPDLEGLTESIQKGLSAFAFLAPPAAEIGIDPAAGLPTGDLPPGVPPATPADTPPAPGDPAADATASPELPPGA